MSRCIADSKKRAKIQKNPEKKRKNHPFELLKKKGLLEKGGSREIREKRGRNKKSGK